MLQLTFKRYEVKYMLTDEQRSRLLDLMGSYMAPDAWGPSTVCNVYYDTPDHLLVRRSVEKPDYKEKVRVRSYGIRKPGDPVFAELKKKYDGVVYKRRCAMDEDRATALLSGKGDPKTQIERELDFTCRRYGGLVPSFYLAYDREAFYAVDDNDFRMTFDNNVRSRTHDMRLTSTDRCPRILEEGKNLLEVKTTGAMPLWLTGFFAEEHLYKISFSKVGRAWQNELEGVLALRNAKHLATRGTRMAPVRVRTPQIALA